MENPVNVKKIYFYVLILPIKKKIFVLLIVAKFAFLILFFFVYPLFTMFRR